jgi:hypothetical protein
MGLFIVGALASLLALGALFIRSVFDKKWFEREDKLTAAQAELAKAAESAKMVKRIEILLNEGFQPIPRLPETESCITMPFAFQIYQKNNDEVKGWGCSMSGLVEAFNKALTALLSPLPEPQRSELAKKLEMK